MLCQNRKENLSTDDILLSHCLLTGLGLFQMYSRQSCCEYFMTVDDVNRSDRKGSS